MSILNSFTSIVRSDLSKPSPEKNSSIFSPAKNFTAEQFDLFLKYARVSELINDIVLDDTLSKISRETTDVKSDVLMYYQYL